MIKQLKPKLNVLIVGVGKIGAFFDSPKSKNILTHAHAFSSHEGFNLIGFVGKNKKHSIKAAKIWNVNYYSDIKKAFELNSIDVVCIAAPTSVHEELLEEILKYPVKLVLLEKPIANTIYKSKKIVELSKETKIPIIVNYIRRFIPEFEKIKSDIDKGLYGSFIAGAGYYGGGLLNNGSHIIDLLHFFLGSIIDFKIISGLNDCSTDDPTITATLTLSNKRNFILQGIDSKSFSLFEMDLVFEKQRIRITESGLEIEFHKIQNNKIFKGYQNMIKYSEKHTSLGKYMYFVADNIYISLTENEAIKCNILDGYKVAELCFRMIKKQP